MKKSQLRTPAMLLDLDVLENNIARYQKLANDNNKQNWPMTKTHKSTEIALMQHKGGAQGFLCGTLDECEALCRAGIKNIMYAYPMADPVAVGRVIALAKACHLTIRLDCEDAVAELNSAAGAAGCKIDYVVIVDVGLHRFGLPPERVPAFVTALKPCTNLVFKGIATHPGHVYGVSHPDEIRVGEADTYRLLGQAHDLLIEAGLGCPIVGCGSTPTFASDVKSPLITMVHPGNYVFHDMLQLFFRSATPEDCALTVLASVISKPNPERIMIDAGSKCLGLDQGGHGVSSVRGYGGVVGHPELEVFGLSEEVGKVRPAGLRVGQRLEIIPNHACSAANLAGYLIGCRGDKVERVIAVDIRANSTRAGA